MPGTDGPARHWTLEPGLAFLNHGGFGACPRPVLEVQAELRAELERQPVEFLVRRLPARLDAAREELAAFLGAEPEDLVWVPNATAGINTVLRSLPFEAGDELVTTDHEYNASRNALKAAAERRGARVKVASVPFPLSRPEQVVEAVVSALGPRTRLVLVDHVTSQTGLVFPLETLLPRLADRGIEVLVDGAHAPGMVPVDLGRLTAAGAVYYAGNCHKWLCAPKGAGFLHVRRDRQAAIRPLAISHGANTPRPGRSRFHDEFDWTGTADPTAYLSVPAALALLASEVPGGWVEVRRRNRELALTGRRLLCAALGIEPPAPETMIGSLAAVPIPDGSPQPPASPLYADPLQEILLARYRIEVPVIPWPAPPRRLLRISAQLYNREEDYRLLARALGDLLAQPRTVRP